MSLFFQKSWRAIALIAFMSLSGQVFAQGTLTLDRTQAYCDDTPLGSTGGCGALWISASGGPITLADPYFDSTSSAFSIAGRCYPGLRLEAGQRCQSYLIFTPPSSGSFAGNTITVRTQDGQSKSVSVMRANTTMDAYLAISPSAKNCGFAAVGETKDCGTFTLTAMRGSVTLISMYQRDEFRVGYGSCSNGMTLVEGQSCETTSLTFQPVQAGIRSEVILFVSKPAGKAEQYQNIPVMGSSATST